jgi:hypothetical protein
MLSSVNPKINAKSSNDSIGSSQHIGWNSQTDLLGGFQVDHQLEFRRLLHRQVDRLALLTILSLCGYAPVTVCEAG